METLKTLFRQWAGEPCVEALAIGAGGSSRRYFRLLAASGRSAIGAIASDRRENEAFFAFTRHLHAKGIRVPQLYAVADDRCHYLQQDLGDQTLYGLLYEKKRQGGGFDSQMLNLYRSALADLADIQQAGADIDFSVAYPTPAFDRRSILWDLNYFKYYYLKLADIPFDEQLLEDDFSRLADLLLQADCNYFMYRDFQGRNIMVVERVESGKWKVESGKSADAPATNAITQSHNNALLYYIDYQGGRRGAAQYDVASLLYSAKSDLPKPIRRELLDHYLDHRGIRGTDRRRWLDHFWLYVYIRILQTLGAYGFRGLYQRKDYFIQSIPLALQNLRRLADEHPLPQETKYLYGVIKSVVDSGEWVVDSSRGQSLPTTNYPLPTKKQSSNQAITQPLTVTVQSFSYKRGLPDDPSGNGGGHIFDCRALPNPGRYAQYKTYTGKDRPVIQFLQNEPAVLSFLDHAEAIVRQSVDKYLERRFTHLSVAFGCTGGQHRSVYCAEQLAARLRQACPDVNIVLRHREQDPVR